MRWNNFLLYGVCDLIKWNEVSGARRKFGYTIRRRSSTSPLANNRGNKNEIQLDLMYQHYRWYRSDHTIVDSMKHMTLTTAHTHTGNVSKLFNMHFIDISFGSYAFFVALYWNYVLMIQEPIQFFIFVFQYICFGDWFWLECECTLGRFSQYLMVRTTHLKRRFFAVHDTRHSITCQHISIPA